MSAPKNPETVVIKNQYYPAGLKEKHVWDYYQRYKFKVIDEINARPIMLWIFKDLNTAIIKRKVFNSPFTITKKNYDKIITGRTVSFAVELRTNTDLVIVDVDPGPTATEHQLKTSVKSLLNSSFGSASFVIGNRIISTARGYHVYFYLKKKFPINSIRKTLLVMLNMEFRNDYLINEKNPKGSNINFDLTPTTSHGVHQVPYALCRNGLQSLDVTNSLDVFSRRSAII